MRNSREMMSRIPVVAFTPALIAAGASILLASKSSQVSSWVGPIVVLFATLTGCWITFWLLLKKKRLSRPEDDARDPMGPGEHAGVEAEAASDMTMGLLSAHHDTAGSIGDQEDFAYQLIDTAQAIVLVLDAQGRILLTNRFMEELTGYRFDEIKGEDWFSTFIPERDRGRLRRLFLKAVGNIRTGGHVSAILTREGAEREIEWHSRTLYGQDGQTVGLLSIGLDVTERRRAEEALRRSEERYRAIVEQQTELISRYTPDGTLTFVNDAYARYFGEKPLELLGNKFWHHVPAEDQPALMKHIASLGPDRPLATIEHPVLTPDGVRWQQWRDRAVLGSDGELVEILAVGRDITDRKEAELKLEKERQRLYALLDGLPAVVCLHDREYIIQFANRAFRESFGSGEGRHCYEVLRGYEGPCGDCMTQKVLETLAPHRSECALEKTGRTYQVFSYPFTDVDGTPLALELWIDDTERKESERALRESESALRALSSRLLKAQEEERKRIAVELHDSIGSSLTGIKMFLQNAMALLKGGESAESALEHLLWVTQNAIEESRRIVTDLRPSILDDLGIVKTVGWFCREFMRMHPNVFVEEVVDVQEEEIPDDLRIVIFRVMQEAFHNIAKHSGAEFVTVDFRRADGKIQITIEDNGGGFDVDSIEVLRKQAQGIGLTGMKERTELSGGVFELRSTPGMGTEVRASWPAIGP